MYLAHNYMYGKKAFGFSSLAIETLSEIYTTLSKEKDNIKTYKNYQDLKDQACNNALKIWATKYYKLNREYDTDRISRKEYLNSFKHTFNLLVKAAENDLNHKFGGNNKA